mmetsp:Transcript_17839/g.58350  ORF Transcript_17839/g.58350 Transcript_17839/m.58350 type:complete len:230 (+) Transcript_17839:1982-2671(+)
MEVTLRRIVGDPPDVPKKHSCIPEKPIEYASCVKSRLSGRALILYLRRDVNTAAGGGRDEEEEEDEAEEERSSESSRRASPPVRCPAFLRDACRSLGGRSRTAARSRTRGTRATRFSLLAPSPPLPRCCCCRCTSPTLARCCCSCRRASTSRATKSPFRPLVSSCNLSASVLSSARRMRWRREVASVPEGARRLTTPSRLVADDGPGSSAPAAHPRTASGVHTFLRRSC